MEVNLYPDILLIIEIFLFFGFAIFSFIRASVITRNISYFHFTIGVFFAFIGSIFLNIPGYFVPDDNKFGVVFLFIILTNIFMGLSVYLFVVSLIFIREDKLPILSHLFALIVGAMLVLISNIDETRVNYDYTSSFWRVDYSSPLFYSMSTIALAFFIVYLSLYLVRKFEKFKKTKHFDLSFVGFATLTLWMVTVHVTAMRVIRHFFFPLTIFIFGLAVFINPLNFLASKKIPDEIFLLSRFDHPIIGYDLKENKIKQDFEEIKLFLASGKMISESMNGYEKPKDLKLKNKEIKHIDLKGYHLIAIGTKIDRNAIAALQTAFRVFRNRVNLDYLGASTVLSEPDEKTFVETINKYIRRINATKKKKATK